LIKNKCYAVLAVMAVLLTMLTGCAGSTAGHAPNRYQATFLNLFDTVTTVIGYDADKEVFTENVQQLHDELETYHQMYDIYHAYDGINNIKVINDNAGVGPVAVDQKIIDLLAFCIEAYNLTEGRLNVAMGSVLSIWHDYRQAGIDDPENARLPAVELLTEASEHTDITKIIIDRDAMTVYLDDPEMKLDVGAVAKGYAVEQVCSALEARGIGNLLVSVGGNVRTIGTKGDGSLWQVGIRDPDSTNEESYLYKLGLSDLSLVSSGSYQRYYTVDGITYHHIINPDTLMPWNNYVSVSILCKDSAMADALSTAIFNMEYETGLARIESLEHTEAMWVFSDGTEAFSSGFKQYIVE